MGLSERGPSDGLFEVSDVGVVGGMALVLVVGECRSEGGVVVDVIGGEDVVSSIGGVSESSDLVFEVTAHEGRGVGGGGGGASHC